MQLSHLPGGWSCDTLTGEEPRFLALFLYYIMTELPNEKLSSWYFTVRYAGLVLQQRIAENEKLGLRSDYDIHNLEKLQDMEQFFKMSWDVWMDELQTACSNYQEAK